MLLSSWMRRLLRWTEWPPWLVTQRLGPQGAAVNSPYQARFTISPSQGQ